MDSPSGVGILSNGNIVVAEWSGNRLQIFDSLGNFVRIVGAGEVLEPQHLFVDADDNILVADSGNHRIQVFNQNGDHIKTIGAGELSYPNGVCMDGKGKIIASDCGSGQGIFIFFFFFLVFLVDCEIVPSEIKGLLVPS